MLTDNELMNKWRAGNDNGCGYAIGEQGMSPEEAACYGGLSGVRKITPDGAVVGFLVGDVIVVADCNGPWAVTVGEEDQDV